MRSKYIKCTDSAGTSVVHASVPVKGNSEQVECDALCGTLIYPPDEGDPDPDFPEDAAVDCPKCKTVLEALACIRAPELIVEVMHTHYRTTRDPEADGKWRESLGLPE